ncbi:MAG: hypothetical protein WCJ75_17835 [Desulfomonile sp.]
MFFLLAAVGKTAAAAALRHFHGSKSFFLLWRWEPGAKLTANQYKRNLSYQLSPICISGAGNATHFIMAGNGYCSDCQSVFIEMDWHDVSVSLTHEFTYRLG